MSLGNESVPSSILNAKSPNPVRRSFLKESFNYHFEDIIIIVDSSGIPVYSLSFNKKDEKFLLKDEDLLISMFITAISNFAKEIFNSSKVNQSLSISINQKSKLMHIEINQKFCIAYIGKCTDRNITDKLKKVLKKIEFCSDERILNKKENFMTLLKNILKSEFEH